MTKNEQKTIEQNQRMGLMMDIRMLESNWVALRQSLINELQVLDAPTTTLLDTIRNGLDRTVELSKIYVEKVAALERLNKPESWQYMHADTGLLVDVVEILDPKTGVKELRTTAGQPCQPAATDKGAILLLDVLTPFGRVLMDPVPARPRERTVPKNSSTVRFVHRPTCLYIDIEGYEHPETGEWAMRTTSGQEIRPADSSDFSNADLRRGIALVEAVTGRGTLLHILDAKAGSWGSSDI